MTDPIGHRRALALEVTGRVQGVGFRPFVHGLASELSLAGSVRNRAGAVEIELEGSAAAIEGFVAALTDRPPTLARVDSVRRADAPVRGRRGFQILPSEDGAGAPVFAPDTATCDECLRELDDPTDRHFGYPLLSCTACGPRLTVVEGAPWDRERTTMAPFALCDACRVAFEDPTDRRFHAQPIACGACGPALDGTVEGFAAAIEAGAVGALKGLGGFHLVCDARRGDVVERLRERKRRPHEPLAVMVADLAAARRRVALGDVEARALVEPARPIVLARRLADADVSPAVAPGLSHLGVMLPYSGLHHLLVRALGDTPLVMTSANVHGAPMIHRDADRDQLTRLADVVLSHPRAIALRVDDSVVRVVDGAPTPLRLGRGAAPWSLPLPGPLAAPAVALGGHLKAAFALGRGDEAIGGPHVGDLDDLEAERSFEALLRRMCDLHRLEPASVVIDAHPDYATRRVARGLGLPIVEVHHHHAHLASAMAEHGLDGEVLGAIFDGAGLGPDGTIWGGELLAGGYRGVRRVGHLRPVPLAGGDAAIREPWRVALAQLRDAGIDPAPWIHVPDRRRSAVEAMLDRAVRSPRTSAVGRLFDAVAYLSGLVREPTFEAHGPMWLESAASGTGRSDHGAYRIDVSHDGILDPRSMWRPLLDDVRRAEPIEAIAARFHDGLAAATAGALARAAERTGLRRVALSGGVFANAVFTEALAARLRAAGLVPFVHRRVPPNDGGLAYGQLSVCAARAAMG